MINLAKVLTICR